MRSGRCRPGPGRKWVRLETGRTGSGRNRKLARPTIISDGLGRPLYRLRVPLLVLRLPGVVDLEAAVELLPAGRQQLDVCGTERKSEEQVRRTSGKSGEPGGRPAVPELTA